MTACHPRMPQALATLFEEVLDGRNEATTNVIEQVLGRPAGTFADYVRRTARDRHLVDRDNRSRASGRNGMSVPDYCRVRTISVQVFTASAAGVRRERP